MTVGLDEQLVVGVVLGVALVVELYEVEVNEVSNCLVDSDISSISVELLLEIGTLRGVDDNMIGDDFSEGLCEVNEPLLS